MTNTWYFQGKEFLCPCQVTLCVLDSKWKTAILWEIRNNNNRFGKLLRTLPNINRGVLSRSLKSLEQDGLITKKEFDGIDLKVEYFFTTYGKTLIPVLEVLAEWGKSNSSTSKKTD